MGKLMESSPAGSGDRASGDERQSAEVGGGCWYQDFL